MSTFKGYKRSIVLDFNYEEVKKGVPEVNRQMALLNAEYKKASEEIANSSDKTGKLALQHDNLTTKLKLQIDKVNILKAELNELKDTEEKNEKAIDKKTIALKNAEAQMLKTRNEIENISNEMNVQISVAEELGEKFINLEKDLALLDVSYEKSKLSYDENTSAVEKFKAEHDYLNEKLDIQKDLVEIQTKLLEESRRETGEASSATKDYAIALAEVEKEYEATKKNLDHVTKELEKQKEVLGKTASEWENISQKTGDVGKTLTKNVTAPIAAIGALGVKSAVDFDTAFTGVIKTVNGTSEQLEHLKESFRNMATEIPASAVEIANVAEVAGQLGIEIENIEAFTRVMIDLGNATNISATEGAKQLAQFANIMHTSQTDFDRIGSTIVQLGNNFATTEADILNMATRLAGAGAQVKMTENELLAFATALTSVGLEAEAGGTAMSKVMIMMQVAVATGGADLESFADVAGMSVGKFKRLFEKDAAEAVMAFVSGLGKLENTGTTAIEVLDNMEIKEVRLRDTLLRASSASDLFAEALKMGNQAWEENTALTKEAETRYASAASIFQLFMNALNEFAMQIGEVVLPPLLKFVEFSTDLVQAFIAIPEPLRKVITTVAMLVATIGPVLMIISTIANSINGISTAMKTVNEIGTLFSSTAGNSVYMTFVKWSAIIIAVVAAVTALVVAINYLIGKGSEMNSAISDITGSMGKTQSQLRSQANNTSRKSYAIGTQYHAGGDAAVHQNEELIIPNLPRGTRVRSELDVAQDHTSVGATYNLNNVTIQANDPKDLIEQIQILVRRGAFS